MMRKLLLFFVFFSLCSLNVFAEDIENLQSLVDAELQKIQLNNEEKNDDIDASTQIMTDKQVQNHISEIGYKLLNANKIDVRMIFVYKNKDSKIKGEPALTKRQIVIYDKTLTFAKNDDELAAYIARKICKSAESYDGMFNGVLTSVQVKSAPKKYEIFFDKRAVDFLVTAGYNPIALITFLHKSEPQRRFDKISSHNLTSKRLAHIYEYIYTKYPSYLLNNEYINDEAYQHFLLTSIENRKKLYKKITNKTKGKVDYE